MIGIIELVEQNLQSMLDSEELKCPSGECDNRRFNVNIYRDGERSLAGDASCQNCDLRIELDLDSEAIERAEVALDALQTRRSQQSGFGIETAE